MIRHSPPAAALASALLPLGLAALLTGCATKRPQAALPSEPAPSAAVEAGPASALDQYRARIPCAVTVRNPRTGPIALESAECVLLVEGAESSRVDGLAASRAGAAPTIEAGGSLSLPLEFLVDARSLAEGVAGPDGPAQAGCRVEARLALRGADDSPLAARASAECELPIVREPRLRITSIRIERDVLVTTNLRLALEVRNPNAFPIEVGSLAYDFYGEGKIWSGGSSDRPETVPARSTAERFLSFEMNFADRDRALFDLVAKLKIVRYRLKGEARVATGLEYLPAFRIAFDESGACQVER